MTAEEKIDRLQNIIDRYEGEDKWQTLTDRRDYESIKETIKALMQMDVLDKIRAEISKALSAETISNNNQQISDVGIGLELALSIIDKYKAESEDKE